MKAHILGAPGTGKTTLAEWIGETFAVPVYDLDLVVYDLNTREERTEPEIRSLVVGIAAEDGWVTEGGYRNEWLRPLLEDADIVVWLDLSWRVTAYRIIKRHVQAEIAGVNRHPGWRRLAGFVAFTYRRSGAIKRESRSLIEQYAAKTRVIRTAADLRRLKDEFVSLRGA